MEPLKCNLITRWKSMDRTLIPVDDLDLSILCALRQNARISNLELAKELGVSEATVRRRVKILEEKGIIKGYSALINCHAVENSIKAFVYIKVDKRHIDEIANELMKENRLITLYRILGEYDLLCECLFLSMKELQEFTDKKLKMEGVITTVTHVVSKAYRPCEWVGI
ncbi:transcriptional regulator, AsnC family [Aciduliprofundum boonei T469]|nr:transcriptional regulator, AsnC family [Aciduliprofundum boonei T469]